MKSAQNQNQNTDMDGSMDSGRPEEQESRSTPAKVETPEAAHSPERFAAHASIRSCEADFSPWLRYNSCPICGRMTSGFCNSRGVAKMTCPGCQTKIIRRDRGRRGYELEYFDDQYVYRLMVYSTAKQED